MTFLKFLFLLDKSSLSLSEFYTSKKAHVALNRKKSIFKQTLERCTNILYGPGNTLWFTKLIIDSVRLLTEKIPGGTGPCCRQPS